MKTAGGGVKNALRTGTRHSGLGTRDSGLGVRRVDIDSRQPQGEHAPSPGPLAVAQRPALQLGQAAGNRQAESYSPGVGRYAFRSIEGLEDANLLAGCDARPPVGDCKG